MTNWLTKHQVLLIHDVSIEIAGGASGMRDEGLLESAMARPLNQFGFGETDIFELAASYAEAISRNHPFIDGNKRTAFYSAVDFLEQNGFELAVSISSEHADMMVSLGQGLIDREVAAEHFRMNSSAIK